MPRWESRLALATSPLRHRAVKGLQLWLERHPALKGLCRPAYFAVTRRRHARVTSRNRDLRNRHAGERCFILFTGPTVDEIDFTLLSGERVFGCALLYKHERFAELHPTFYADIAPVQLLYNQRLFWEVHHARSGIDVDPTMLSRALTDLYFEADKDAGAPNALRETPLDFWRGIDRACPPDTVVFMNACNRLVIQQSRLFSGRRVAYVAKTAPAVNRAVTQSNDLAGPITFFDGIAFFSVAAAMYMGFSEIYLCGAGYTYRPRREFHFYDGPRFPASVGEAAADAMAREFAEARGVTLRSLRRIGERYVPEYVRDLPLDERHRTLDQFARNQGTTIYNVTPEGYESPVYRRVSWSEVAATLSERGRRESVRPS